MEDKYKLTVIMSNYNQEQYIAQAIESVLMQKTEFPFQLIITDDHSTKDNSLEIIKKYEEKYSHIKVLYNKENGRYLKNILRAKAMTKTEYFTLLDADDYWTDDNYLQNAVDFLEKNKDFVIYSRNVECFTEQGTRCPFIDVDIENKVFSLDDYINDSVLITQTTGTVFRNVIFSKGIPEIMEKAVGTIAERSFEGDFDRYIMHLKYGKAYFENKFSGVYRIISSGIWSRLNDFEKCAIEARVYIDYDEYFEHKYHDCFMNLMYKKLQTGIKVLSNILNFNDFHVCDEAREKFFNVLEKCVSEKEVIDINKYKKLKFKHKIYLRLWAALDKKLRKKGIIY